MSEQPTPADLTAILAKHAPTFTEMAHDPTTTFYCKSCSEAAGDWVTWTPEHLAEQITAAGFGPVRAVEVERDAAVQATAWWVDRWSDLRGVLGVVADRVDEFTYDEFASILDDAPCDHEGEPYTNPRAEQAEAREKALRESVETLAEKWRGRREPFGNALLGDLHALLATSPDREGSA